MKTILFHVQDDDGLASGLANAAAIARAVGGHVSCLHAVPTIAYFDSDDMEGGTEAVAARLDSRAEALQAEVAAALSAAGIPFDYRHIVTDTEAEIVRRASLCDLIVTSRRAPRGRSHEGASGRLGAILHGSPVPIFLPGDDGRVVDPAGPVLIAWDGSHEAANAVRQSVALLALAGSVRALRVSGTKREFGEERLADYLARYGIAVEMVHRDSDEVTATIVEEAGDGLIVMGAYSHSRVGEFLFGGVTRRMLKACPTGAILAH